MRLFRFSQEAASLMQDIRRYAAELNQEVDKAFDIIVQERGALKKVDYIKGLEDYERDWKRIVESLEYMKSLAKLTANGDEEAWKEALEKGITRSRMGGGMYDLWTKDERERGDKVREREKKPEPRGPGETKKKEEKAKPESKPEPKPEKETVKRPAVEETYRIETLPQAEYFLKRLTAKFNSDLPPSIDDIDKDWMQAFVGLEIIKTISLDNRENRRGDVFTADVLEPLLSAVQNSVNSGEFTDLIVKLYQSDNPRRRWMQIVGAITPQAQKLIADIENKTRGASSEDTFEKFAAPVVDPRSEDVEKQVAEIYDDFLAIKKGERLNKAFSVATNRIQRIITHLYQQAEKLYRMVDSPEDKESVKMVFDGMRWMAKIGEMLQLRGDKGEQEWATAKQSGLDQLEIAGIEEEDIDVDDPPPTPPAPGPDTPDPNAPETGEPGTPEPGTTEPGQPGGDPGSAPLDDPRADLVSQLVNSLVSMSGDANAVAREIIDSVGTTGDVKDKVMRYFAGMVYNDNVNLQTLLRDIEDPQSSKGAEALKNFDYSFRRSVADAVGRLENRESADYRKMVQYALGDERNTTAENGVRMAEILKQRLQYGEINPEALGEAGEDLQESEVPAAPEDKLTPLINSVKQKMQTSDLRDAIANLSDDELRLFVQNFRQFLMESDAVTREEAVSEILGNLGVDTSVAAPQQQQAVDAAIERALGAALQMLTLPAEAGNIPKNLLAMFRDAIREVGIENLTDPNASTQVVEKFMKLFRDALSSKIQPGALQTQNAKSNYRIWRLGRGKENEK